MAAARPRPELAPVMTAVGFCCSFGTSVLAAERAPEVTAGAAATACATTEAPREGAEEAEEAAAMDFLSCWSWARRRPRRTARPRRGGRPRRMIRERRRRTALFRGKREKRT